MRYIVLTLFPEIVEGALGASIIQRARDAGLISLHTIQIRDYAVNDYGKVDDALYGGGTGMLMMADPVHLAWQAACSEIESNARCLTVHLTPKGRRLNQALVQELSRQDGLILLCGHYEGIDQRVLDEVVDLEVSLGDFVLTGGELAAACLIEATARLIPGVLPDSSAHEQESHATGLLEQPHYTRPACWHGQAVPDVLRSGHAAKIASWQRQASLAETLEKRPDLLTAASDLSAADWQLLVEWYQNQHQEDVP